MINTNSKIDRRKFMKLGGMISAAALLPDTLLASGDTQVFEKSLSFHNLHTGETLRSTFWAEGNYISGALDEINHILRDHRTGTSMPMNAELLDLLYDVRSELDSKKPYQIISGYRSPKTNAALHKHSSGVAKKSLHMEGKAIDINLPSKIQNVGLRCYVDKVTCVVSVKAVLAIIIGHIEILVAVIVKVFPRRRQAVASVVVIETRLPRHVGKFPLPLGGRDVIAEQHVSAAIVGVVVDESDRRFIA